MAVCSWEHDLWWELADDRWVAEHPSILPRLDVECRALTDAEALDRYWEGLPRPRRPKPRGQRDDAGLVRSPLAQCSAA